MRHLYYRFRPTYCARPRNKDKWIIKTLGLIDGMSWEPTVPYYRLINEHVQRRIDSLHATTWILYSVDFHDIEPLQAQGAWRQAVQQLSEKDTGLRQAGVADEVERACQLPVLHIADCRCHCRQSETATYNAHRLIGDARLLWSRMSIVIVYWHATVLTSSFHNQINATKSIVSFMKNCAAVFYAIIHEKRLASSSINLPGKVLKA